MPVNKHAVMMRLFCLSWSEAIVLWWGDLPTESLRPERIHSPLFSISVLDPLLYVDPRRRSGKRQHFCLREMGLMGYVESEAEQPWVEG